MKSLKTETLIIGAGPAGLACAMELYKAGRDFIILEKADQVGGLAKTYKFTEEDGLTFYTDNGPHRFFSKNPYLYSFIEDIIGEDWIKVKRNTRQYIDGKFYDYPVNAIQALGNLGLLKSVKMGLDYIWAKIVYRIFGKKIKTFKDYAVANFGWSLAKFNIINYTEKIWGIDSKEIHPDWAMQRIKGLNLTSLAWDTIKKLFISKTNSPKTLVDEFHYPSKGSGLIYEKIYEKITNEGYKVFLGAKVSSIKYENNIIKSVSVFTSDGEMVIECDNLVESVPITEFVKLLGDTVPVEVLSSSESLKHRSQVYLFMTLDRDHVTNDQWIYFPSRDNKIARISEMKNFSKEMSPKGKTSLFVEFFCFEDDEIWNASKEDLLDIAVSELNSMNLIKKEEVRKVYHIKQKDCYPIYDLKYKEYLKVIKNYLDGFDNLYYIGRPGRFKYNNQDHSLEMGILTAKSIIQDYRLEIDDISEEKEYFESKK